MEIFLRGYCYTWTSVFLFLQLVSGYATSRFSFSNPVFYLGSASNHRLAIRELSLWIFRYRFHSEFLKINPVTPRRYRGYCYIWTGVFLFLLLMPGYVTSRFNFSNPLFYLDSVSARRFAIRELLLWIFLYRFAFVCNIVVFVYFIFVTFVRNFLT